LTRNNNLFGSTSTGRWKLASGTCKIWNF